jgi:hypothetical protein
MATIVDLSKAEYVIFKQYQGDTLKILMKWKDKATGNPKDLTGWVFKAQIYLDGVLITTLSTGNGITTGGTGNNETLIFKNPFLIDKSRRYKIDLQATLPDGTIKTFVYGRIQIREEVTI